MLAELVLHHVDARAQLLAEIARVLRPGGWLVVATHHPTSDQRRLGGSHFAREGAPLPLAGGRRPLSELAATDPVGYARLCTEPAFLTLRLRRP